MMPGLNNGISTLDESASSPPSDDCGFLSDLITNSDRGRFLRAAVLLFLAFSSVGFLLLTKTFVEEYRARHSWPVARGEVVSCADKTGEGSRRKPLYWMECEVRFEVPVDQCLTGTTAAGTREPYPCYGTIRSPSTTAQGTTFGWTNPQFLSAPKRILHNPNGPEVRFADEPVWLAYDLANLLMMSGWMIVCLVLLAMIQWRIRVIEQTDLNARTPELQMNG